MLGICSEASLCEDVILSADRPTPSQTKCVFAVAADDVILMCTAGPGSTTSSVEESIEANGMKCHTDRDVDDQLDALCIVFLLRLGYDGPEQGHGNASDNNTIETAKMDLTF